METRDDHNRAASGQGSAGPGQVDELLSCLSQALTLEELIARLARSFRASAAGLFGPVGSDRPLVCRVGPDGRARPPLRWPWENDPQLLNQAKACWSAVAVSSADLGEWLLTGTQTPDGSAWLFWLEGAAPATAPALTLAALALTRWATAEPDRPLWARPLARPGAQHRLNEAALVARRLAHDFGNVLTGVLGFCELALNHAADDSPARRFLREAYHAAEQGADLVRLLQLSGCRKAVQSASPSALPVVAAEEAARVRRSLEPGREFIWDVPADLPPVAIGGELLRTLLAQVLDNAREALTGRGRITLSARPVLLSAADCAGLLGSPEPRGCVEVRVADTGCGLSPEVRRQLFAQPFFSTKPRHRGLGLAVVHGILSSHSGGFRLDSPPPAVGGDGEGKGMVAKMYLPLAPVAAAGTGPCGLGGSEKVLVVDDEAAIRQMVGATLQTAGYRVETAGSAAEALDRYTAAAHEPFHLVLSDVVMPQVNGFDLARRLLAHDANVNVLFMSGHVSAELAQAHGAHWNFELLFKPFRSETLLRAVRAALERGSRKAPAGSGGSREVSVIPSSM